MPTDSAIKKSFKERKGTTFLHRSYFTIMKSLVTKTKALLKNKTALAPCLTTTFKDPHSDNVLCLSVYTTCKTPTPK